MEKILCIHHSTMNLCKVLHPSLCSENYVISILSNLLEQITNFSNTQNCLKTK